MPYGSKMSIRRTQHNVPDWDSYPTAWSRGKHTNHEATVFPTPPQVGNLSVKLGGWFCYFLLTNWEITQHSSQLRPHYWWWHNCWLESFKKSKAYCMFFCNHLASRRCGRRARSTALVAEHHGPNKATRRISRWKFFHQSQVFSSKMSSVNQTP